MTMEGSGVVIKEMDIDVMSIEGRISCIKMG